ncbi:MAG: hypothetical protein RSD49_06550 [Hafnia sp.]
MSIQLLPDHPERVETGPVQFGNDWPGIFLRGDCACGTAFDLVSKAAKVAQDSQDAEVLTLCFVVAKHAEMLAQADTNAKTRAMVLEHVRAVDARCAALGIRQIGLF